jgi:hypothetical protein
MDFRGKYVFYIPICIELRMQPTSFINSIQSGIFLYASSDTVAYCRLLENGGHSGLSLEILFLREAASKADGRHHIRKEGWFVESSYCAVEINGPSFLPELPAVLDGWAFIED